MLACDSVMFMIPNVGSRKAVNTQDKDYKSIEKEIIRNEKRIGT